MIVRTKHFGERELRFSDTDSNPPSRSNASWVGLPVTEDAAYGLPAVSAVIRSVAETVASLSLIVYRDKAGTRERATGSWQYDLLHDRPSFDTDAFQLLYDVAVSLEATQNAFIEKVKVDGG